MAADAVVAQKGVVAGAAVSLAAEVAATQGEALVTFGLAEAEVPIKSGKAISAFSESDSDVFNRYKRLRKSKYPVFIAAKRSWEGVLDALPPKASQALKHHVLPGAQQVIRNLNPESWRADRWAVPR